MTIEKLAVAFWEEKRVLGDYSETTIRKYRYHLNVFRVDTGLTNIDEVTEDCVRTFFYNGRTVRQWSSGTHTSYYNTLIVFFRWCVERNYLSHIPMQTLARPSLPKAVKPKFSRAEAMRLLEVTHNYPWTTPFIRTRNHAIIATALYAGLRKTELLRLRLSDVDTANATILVRYGKGKKDRYVPIAAGLSDVLNAYHVQRARAAKTCPEFFTSSIYDMGFSDSGLKRMVDKLKKATGMKLHLHKLRHTFATLMLEGGCDIFSLSKMMGHGDIKTTAIYLAATPEHLRSEMRKHPLNKTSQCDIH